MNTISITPKKQSVSFRWDSALVEALKEIAKKQNRSLSNFTETILSHAIKAAEGEVDIPNTKTKAAIQETMKHQEEVARGTDNGKDYVDLSSIEDMLKSAGI